MGGGDLKILTLYGNISLVKWLLRLRDVSTKEGRLLVHEYTISTNGSTVRTDPKII